MYRVFIAFEYDHAEIWAVFVLSWQTIGSECVTFSLPKTHTYEERWETKNKIKEKHVNLYQSTLIKHFLKHT